MGRALVNGTLTNDTNRELEKWLFGGACPELLLEPCDRCPVNSLSHDHQVSVTELDMQQALGTWGLPWWLSGKESTCQCRRHRFDPWVGKIPWRMAWQPSQVFLPGESHGQWSLEGYSPWGHKEWDMI